MGGTSVQEGAFDNLAAEAARQACHMLMRGMMADPFSAEAGVIVGDAAMMGDSGTTRPWHGPTNGVTAREREVLTALAEGLTMKEMASRFGVGISTLDKHVRSIKEKLDRHTHGGIVAAALREGIIK